MVVASSLPRISTLVSSARGALVNDPESLVGQQSNVLRLWLTKVMCGAALPFLVLILPVELYPTVDPLGAAILLLAIVIAGSGFTLASNNHAVQASLVVIVGAIVVITLQIGNIGLLGTGFDISHVGLLDWYIVPSVIGALLLRRNAALVVTACCSALMILELLLLPRTPLLDAFWRDQAPYPHAVALDLFVLPLALNWMMTAVLHVVSVAVRRVIQDAVRADELSQANERIVAQHREMSQHRERLYEGMQQIQSTYAAVQRGNLSARVQSPHPELLPLALSFNLLLDRLTRLSQENAFYRQMLERERVTTSDASSL